MAHKDDITAKFNGIVGGFKKDNSPYGAPSDPSKRRKLGMALAGAAVVGATTVGYSAYAANEAEADLKAQEIRLQMERLELERIKYLNEADNDQDDRSKDVKGCIENAMVKASGFTNSADVISQCNSAFPTSITTATEAVASESKTSAEDGDGELLAVALAVGVFGLAAIARRPKQG